MAKIYERKLISNGDLPTIEVAIRTFEVDNWLLEQFFVVTLPMEKYYALLRRIVPQ